jgi:phosphoribosylaminoimidazole-succinocarboxamide synthase
MNKAPIMETQLPNLLYRGKVRDTYNLDERRLLMVASDRISAFDVVLPTGIPGKGLVLSRMSAFWFHKTAHLVPNHLIAMGDDLEAIPEGSPVGNVPLEIARQAMVVQKAQRVDIECIVRGYLAGSAWAEYQKEGTVFGNSMPRGLKEGQIFPEPIFTPTTKAEEGHDENISIKEVENMVGVQVARELAEKSIAVYEFARDYASQKGIILADTKLEFGFVDDEMILIDEIFTPDSSRFWDADGYEPGRSQPNFDKQYVRDWLVAQGWNREPPAPLLPQDIVEKTSERYQVAFSRLTGQKLPL